MLVPMKETLHFGILVKDLGLNYAILCLYIVAPFIEMLVKEKVGHITLTGVFYIVECGKKVRCLAMEFVIVKMARLLEKENGKRISVKKKMEPSLI